MQTIGPVAASVVLGYLFGSMSPAYLLGRLLRRVDIRTVGFANAGTRNVKAQLGLWPAVVTAVIDTGKGVVALVISAALFDLPAQFLAVPAAAAVVGHIFPFYLRFRGGRGSATAVGIFLYLIGGEMAKGRFAPTTFGVLLAIALITYLASRSGDVSGLLTFFAMAVMTPLELGLTAVSMLSTGLAVFLFVSVFFASRRHGVFTLERSGEIKVWRLAIRPFALLFIPIEVLFGRRILLLLIGALALVFIGTDLVRLLAKWELSRLFKHSERDRFSSMSLFLVSIFLTFLVFPGPIPYLGLVFITIGDLGSKLIGMKYGSRRLFKSRTLEGLLGFIAMSLLSAYVLHLVIPVPLIAVIIGSIVAGITELFSENINDNFSVSLVSCGFLYALRVLLGG